MGYWKAKSDLEFIEAFKNDVLSLGNIENRVSLELQDTRDFIGIVLPTQLQQATQVMATRTVDGYQDIRERVNKGILRALRIGYSNLIPLDVHSTPAPMVGGAIIRQNILMAVIQDNSHGGIPRQMILDTLNQIIGACEARVETERRHLWNPFYWFLQAFKFIIRIPFMLIELSGFDVHKVEEHFISKAFKLVEVAGIFYLLYRLGMTNEQFRELIAKLIK